MFRNILLNRKFKFTSSAVTLGVASAIALSAGAYGRNQLNCEVMQTIPITLPYVSRTTIDHTSSETVQHADALLTPATKVWSRVLAFVQAACFSMCDGDSHLDLKGGTKSSDLLEAEKKSLLLLKEKALLEGNHDIVQMIDEILKYIDQQLYIRKVSTVNSNSNKIGRHTLEMMCPLIMQHNGKMITVECIVDGDSKVDLIIDEDDVAALGLKEHGQDVIDRPDGSTAPVTIFEPVQVSITLANGSKTYTFVRPCCLVVKKGEPVGEHVKLTHRILGYPLLRKLAYEQDLSAKRLTQFMRRL